MTSPAEPPAPPHDWIVIGGGASGMVAAISAARQGKRVLILEQSAKLGIKLLASGGERCNLSNTLSSEDFMGRVGPTGRFMGPALERLGGPKLREFFAEIGLETVVLDGFRVWPIDRKSVSVLRVLVEELQRAGVEVRLNCRVTATRATDGGFEVEHTGGLTRSHRLLLATGGLALPKSGASGEGYSFAESLGLSCTPRYPAGVPFTTLEDWPARLTAHTIGKAHLKVAIKKHARIQRTGDLIFTRTGLRGPVVLDLSREISPLLEKYDSIPLVMNLCRGMNAEDWRSLFKAWRKEPSAPLAERMAPHLPSEVFQVLCELAGVDPAESTHTITGADRDALIEVLVQTPITVSGTTGYAGAFITRGGVRLKDVNPDTLESKVRKGLYLAGEVLDLDGPCGGFNLQWAFASGYLAGLGLGADEREPDSELKR
ncbi:MAG: aminoacetone oxidase family FAD-binding enzyme [Planctomycetes bacterium]|nr:aminoacetone oxidase family FAD-binding enzyme [Planctomycetota bacterium]